MMMMRSHDDDGGHDDNGGHDDEIPAGSLL